MGDMSPGEFEKSSQYLDCSSYSLNKICKLAKAKIQID